jgi:hypothetical protein
MSHKPTSAAVLASLLAFTSMAEAKKPPALPAGTRVVSAKQFDIYAELKESKPFAGTYSMLNIYSITVVVHQTSEHEPKRFISRMEAFDASLLDPSMWQVGDFNGDGYEDYRAVSGINNNGCHTWTTRTWLPKRTRFTYGTKNNYVTDANGKQIKSCYP